MYVRYLWSYRLPVHQLANISVFEYIINTYIHTYIHIIKSIHIPRVGCAHNLLKGTKKHSISLWHCGCTDDVRPYITREMQTSLMFTFTALYPTESAFLRPPRPFITTSCIIFVYVYVKEVFQRYHILHLNTINSVNGKGSLTLKQ